MKIFLDDGLSTTVELTGIGHQCLGLFQHLSDFAEVALADYRLLRYLPKKVRRGIYLVIANMWRGLVSYDVMHFVNFYTPWRPFRSAKVVTIHDLTMFRHAELLSPRYLRYIQRAVTCSVQRADLIIVPSYTTKNEIMEFFPKVPVEKIGVCFNGLRDIFWSKPFSDEVDAFGLTNKNFFLFVGTLEARKKVDFLLDCFREAREIGAIASETMLVLVGRKGLGYEQIERKIPGDGSVRVLGHVPDREMVQLYHQAKAFVYPSLYEGFGIPLIEAMSCRLPIIRSEIAASAEIDERHNSQMFVFSFKSSRTLVEKLAELDKMANQIRKKLNYGDLSIYRFQNVAKQHLDAYRMALEMKSQAARDS
jgi:glycosyltransferase involved in cell wall biosynthesis